MQSIPRQYAGLWLRQASSGTWNIGDTISGAVGALAAVVAHYYPQLAYLVNESLWLVPIYGLAATAVFRLLFFAPYEIWKKERLRADVSEEKTRALGGLRPLVFQSIEFLFKPGGSELAQLKFSHVNTKEHLVSYTIENVFIRIGEGQTDVPEKTKLTYVQPHSDGSYTVDIPHPPMVTEFPAIVYVNFDYRYDTVPPVRERHTGALLRYLVHGFALGSRVEPYIYEEQREN